MKYQTSTNGIVGVKRNIALGESVYKDFSKILKNLIMTGPANPALKKYFNINLDAMYVGGQLDIKIHKHELLDNKILFVRLDEDDDFPAVLNGSIISAL